MAKHILLIDGNSLMHASHSTTPLTVGGTQIQAAFGVLKSLRAISQRMTGDKQFLILWDGRAQFRLDLYPEYKGNRAAMTPEQEESKAAFKKQAPILEKALSMLGLRQMRSPLLEADDLAGYVVPRLVAAGHKVTMFSGDKDWLQLVGPGVSWDDPIRDRRVDVDNFFDFTGYFTTQAFLEGKALQGDSSDNIFGLDGLGEKGASLFLAKWKTVGRFLNEVDSGAHVPETRKSKAAKSLHPEQILASPEGRAIFKRNMKLMDWSQSRKPQSGEVVSKPAIVNVEGFETLCIHLSFQSILREFPQFLRAFNIQYNKETA
jgi:DNA polymerase-1